MSVVLRSQKRPRRAGQDPTMDVIMDAQSEPDPTSPLPFNRPVSPRFVLPEIPATPQTYASKAADQNNRSDVRFNNSKFAADKERIKIIQATTEIPFKQIDWDEHLNDTLVEPWKNAIILKVVGKPWYYPALLGKLEAMWSIHGNADLLELGNNCFCLKNLSNEKRDLILTEGPWQLAGSFLSVRKWQPNFRADTYRIDSTITWVRVLNLPMEMFDESIIQSIASCIGDPIKIDASTFGTKKGRFARFCVQVQIDKPLELGIYIRGKVYQIQYENIPTLCHNCGKVGHNKPECPLLRTMSVEPPSSGNTPSQVGESSLPSDQDPNGLVDKAKNKEFGDWMLVERKKKKKQAHEPAPPRTQGRRALPVQHRNQNTQQPPAAAENHVFQAQPAQPPTGRNDRILPPTITGRNGVTQARPNGARPRNQPKPRAGNGNGPARVREELPVERMGANEAASFSSGNVDTVMCTLEENGN
ncbi:hypothetical protein OROMI_029874 [Orobanche minor]